MTSSSPEPMLTVAVNSPALPAGWGAEPKWDGFRAQLAVHTSGRVLLRSRQGTNMTGSFPEIREAALAQLPADTSLDGELVVWESGRLAFERLQQRLARRGAGAVEAARQWPANYVVFDLVHAGEDVTGWPYQRRRASLKALFADHGLGATADAVPGDRRPVRSARMAGVDDGRAGETVLRTAGRALRPERSIVAEVQGPRPPPKPSLVPSPAHSRRLRHRLIW
ncbi:hypothetical protein ACFY9A_39765 [Streptomyces rubradiris]|uniref:ATP-dependent DNA ligase n=1 Tax=Streptomyces rubradiris TaxID=285531 RepID=UPI0036E4CE44